MADHIGGIVRAAQAVIANSIRRGTARYAQVRFPTWHTPKETVDIVRIKRDLVGIEGRVINIMPADDYLKIAGLVFEAGAASYTAVDHIVGHSVNYVNRYNALTEQGARDKLGQNSLHLLDKDPLTFLTEYQQHAHIIVSSLDARLFDGKLVNQPPIQAYLVALAKQIETVSKGYKLFGDLPAALARHIKCDVIRANYLLMGPITSPAPNSTRPSVERPAFAFYGPAS